MFPWQILYLLLLFCFFSCHKDCRSNPLFTFLSQLINAVFISLQIQEPSLSAIPQFQLVPLIELQGSQFRFGIRQNSATPQRAPLNIDGAVCVKFLRGPSATQTGRRDAKYRFLGKKFHPFRATSGESLAEFSCYHIAIAVGRRAAPFRKEVPSVPSNLG